MKPIYIVPGNHSSRTHHMLTQCPECKTAFRLHVNQLKAAAGKVRCSRCHTTFDALDNLFGALAPDEKPAPTPAPELPTEQAAAPEPITEAPIARPSVEEATTSSPEEDERERLTSMFDEPTAAPTADNEDPLNHLIDELEESTTNGDTTSLPLVGEDAQRGLPADIAAALNALGEITTDEEPIDTTAPPAPAHRSAVGSHSGQDEEIVSAALDSIDGLFGVEGLDETPEEIFEEVILVEPVEDEPLPLVEVEEPVEAPAETFEEVFSLEPVKEEEPLPLVEVEEPVEAPAETFEEVFSLEPVKEEPLPLVEVEEPVEAPAETFEEFFSLEPVKEEEPLPLVEVEEPVETPAETFEEFFSLEPVEDESEEENPAEELISADELDALFDEAIPEVPAGETVEEPETEAAIGEEELDSFFVAPQRDDMGDFFNEEPDPIAEQILAETPIELSDEPFYDPTEASDLFSDEADKEAAQTPIEVADEAAMAEVTLPEEQAAEEASSQQAPRYTPEVVALDSAASAEEEPHTEVERIHDQPAAPSGYTIPTELTQARRASGKGAVLWGMGIVLMCGALVLQYLYYFRLQLVENPQLRPLLVTMCEVTDCKLPPRRDLGHIALSDHQMQFHPNYEQSLLITATLANRADFAQPYPLVEVLMTDIEQRVVARRHFTPEQYMPRLTGNSFPANSEIPLMLEVVDPGNSAVGFEFRFY